MDNALRTPQRIFALVLPIAAAPWIAAEGVTPKVFAPQMRVTCERFRCRRTVC